MAATFTKFIAMGSIVTSQGYWTDQGAGDTLAAVLPAGANDDSRYIFTDLAAPPHPTLPPYGSGGSETFFYRFNPLTTDNDLIPVGSTITRIDFGARVSSVMMTDTTGIEDAYRSTTVRWTVNGVLSDPYTLATSEADPATNFDTISSFCTINPLTGVAWTLADLDTLDFGIYWTGGYQTFNDLGWVRAVLRLYQMVIKVTYVDPAASITPSTGAAAGGTSVTITGGGDDWESGKTTCVVNGVATFTAITVVNGTTVTATTPATPNGPHTVVLTTPNATVDYGYNPVATYANAFTFGTPTYELDLPGLTVYQFTSTPPPDFTLPNPVFFNGVFYATGTVFEWQQSSAVPTDKGWWLSVDEDFAGEALVLSDSRPKNPRSFAEITAFANGSTGMMGGFPGPSCMFNNHMVYAAGGYTLGTDAPSIRITDGQFDREVCQLPKTAAGATPRAVMTMLTANGTIYLSTLDSGSSSSDWSGRVFRLDIESGQLAPIGAALTTGHVPYALAWHEGRLWCGTNRQSSAASGKIFFFRPDIDTVWTDDYTLSSSSVAGCTSLLSYKGILYVGTSNAAAAFAKVLRRSELGVYTTSQTGSGGTAAANNAFLALAEFSGKLYATFFNADTPLVSKIYKFDNTSWSTSYTGATSTLVPFIALPVDRTTLVAIGGGLSYNGTVLTTADGTTWSDKTAFLSQNSPASTALPVWGILMA